MPSIEPALLGRMWPNAQRKTVEGFCELSPEIFAELGITSARRLKHFMGQISHESDGASLPGMRESLFYTTPQRLCKVWPKRFPTIESAIPYLRNERKLADKVYSGRMGNRPGTSDAFDFRGGGFLQNTGREMYLKLSERTGIDLVGNPDLINDLGINIRCAAIEFCSPAILRQADNDNAENVSRLINTGTINPAIKVVGLDERIQWTNRWGRALAA